MTRLSKAEQIKADQQAELKRLRAEKRAKAKAVAEHVETVQPEVEHADIKSFMDGLDIPTPKRLLVGFILSIAVAGAVGYVTGIVLSYVIACIAVLGAGALVTFLLTALAWIIAVFASVRIGHTIGGTVFQSTVSCDGAINRSYTSVSNVVANAKSKVLGFFKSEPVEQFTGAHTV